jgi:NAD(P)-dependent dehydrogenase (short-subunit alcohol dehydrogenase family)
VTKKPLSEQVVVVTGASSGHGRAIARGAGERGAKVVVTARNSEALDNAVREIEAFGSEALAVPADHAVRDDVAQPDELRRVFDANFFGTVNGFWAALPHLKETHGTFVHVSSALAYLGIPLQAAYCASKAAGRTLLESARVELQEHGVPVDVCVVLPGAINTPQFDRSRQRIGFQPQPMPPIYQPEPFAQAVLHCCEHPVRELPVGWGAQKLLWGQKLSPRVGDRILLRNGWRSQHTQELKPTDSPDNLFQPLPGDPGAHGRFDEHSRATSAWTWLRLRRGIFGAGIALATMGLLASREGRFPRR